MERLNELIIHGAGRRVGNKTTRSMGDNVGDAMWVKKKDFNACQLLHFKDSKFYGCQSYTKLAEGNI